MDDIKSGVQLHLKQNAEENDSESEEESQELMIKALSGYYSELGGIEESENILQIALNKNNSCLICLSGIKRVQAVWSCRLCYTLFHLVCIQQWAKDGVFVKNAILSEELFPNIPLKWTCPKCRTNYNRADTPSVYLCFCGKQVRYKY